MKIKLLAILFLVSTSLYAQTVPMPLVFVPITPCRIIDTRGTANVPYNAGGMLKAAEVRSYDLNSAPAPCNNILSSSTAFSINITVAGAASPGYVAVYPKGNAPSPLVSTLNFMGSEPVANAAIVSSDPFGNVSFLSSSNAHLIVDVNGYYVPLCTNGSVPTLVTR